MPNWVSKPSAVWPNGVAITPALAITTSNGSSVRDQRVGAGAHACERGEIELDQLEAAAVRRLGADLRRRALRLGEVARGADHLRAVRGERARRLDAQPGRDAGHQHALAAEIDACEHVVGGGRRIESLGS